MYPYLIRSGSPERQAQELICIITAFDSNCAHRLRSLLGLLGLPFML